MKKIISIILSLVLVFSIPITVFADSELSGNSEVLTTPATGNGEGDGTIIPPVSGEEETTTTPPVSGEEETTTTPPVSGEEETTTTPPVSGEEETTTTPPVSGEEGTTTTPPVSGEGETTTTPPVSGEETTTIPPVSGDEGEETTETQPTEPQTYDYTFVYISDEKSNDIVVAENRDSALAKAPAVSQDVITAIPDENKHYIEKYKWELSAENEFIFYEVIDEENSETVACSEFEDYDLAATCIAEGLENAKKCVACDNISGGEIVEKTAHNLVYEISHDPDCVEDGKILAKCTTDGCEAEFEYSIPATHHLIPGECTKAPTCMEKGKQLYVCDVCKQSFEVEIEKDPTNHQWIDSSLSCANGCGAKDTVTEILNVECDKTEYFVGDAWNSTLTLKVKCGEREVNFTTTENLLKDFTTAETGEKTFAVCIDGVVYDNATVTINVKKPRLSVKVNNQTVYDESVEDLRRDGVAFSVVSSSGDEIKYKVSSKYLVAKESDGIITVKPKKHFLITYDNYKSYYICFYFKRNGITYSQDVYFFSDIKSVKCSTSSKTITNGSKTTLTLKFTETYEDGTKKTYKEDVILKGSSVGKKTYKSDYYGSYAPYTYYVKCKAPTLKAKAGTKAVTLSWNKVSGATGYKIYRSTSKNGTYKEIKTISGNSTVSYKNTKLSSKKTYYYKIVAVYSKTSKCNSSYSSVAYCKTK